MSDGWARPSGGGPPDGVIEIELTERGPPRQSATANATGESARGDRHRGRWIVVAVALVATVAVVGSFALDGGDDLATPGSTVLDPSQITTPPTLASLQTVPAATVPPTLPAAAVSAPASSMPFDPTDVTVPTFEVVPNAPPGLLATFDLSAAVLANVAGAAPIRTRLMLEGVRADGQFRSTADVLVLHDPQAGRDSLLIERNVGETARIITDRSQQLVFRTDTGLGDRWERLPGESFVNGTRADTIDELFDSLVTGPITSDVVAAATAVVPDDRLVQLDDGRFARAHLIVVPLDAIRPYGLLLFANIFEGTVDDGEVPESLEFTAYVTDASQLALVTVRFEAAGVVFALTQSLDDSPDQMEIELPDPASLFPLSQ